MNVDQKRVKSFHRKNGITISLSPTLALPEAQRRFDFIKEELTEYGDAVAARDIVGVADALGDLMYVVLGAALVHGIDMESVFEEIHRSNMTKQDLNEIGKGGKGPNYEPPRLATILRNQGGAC